eukprot:TRINITY_DN17397_c0_g1_i1.p1 TRINITY_DN17397_c0_g1~~TRINITY_DN17397_c0_g1_i1.p1  ORF type:complete len:220 (-),score=5.00 TRINITY_DN17397_c0_g1_i1:321-980(-)
MCIRDSPNANTNHHNNNNVNTSTHLNTNGSGRFEDNSYEVTGWVGSTGNNIHKNTMSSKMALSQMVASASGSELLLDSPTEQRKVHYSLSKQYSSNPVKGGIRMLRGGGALRPRISPIEAFGSRSSTLQNVSQTNSNSFYGAVNSSTKPSQSLLNGPVVKQSYSGTSTNNVGGDTSASSRMSHARVGSLPQSMTQTKILTDLPTRELRLKSVFFYDLLF